jgi:hypothetical protein
MLIEFPDAGSAIVINIYLKLNTGGVIITVSAGGVYI